MTASTVRIPIIGLGCGGSDPAILEKALTRLPAVRHVYVNPVTESAYLTVDATRFRMVDALNEIAQCGYHGLSADREREPTVLDDDFADLMFGHLVRAQASDDERRVERIATEALEAFRRLADVRRAVSVFGSARSGAIDQWGELARETARALGGRIRSDYRRWPRPYGMCERRGTKGRGLVGRTHDPATVRRAP